MVVHPVCAEVEFARGIRDARTEPFLCVWKAEGAILGHEGTVDVVDVLRALAMVERLVEDHDGAAVHDEAHLAPEGVVETLGEVGQRLLEELARERDVVDGFQSRSGRLDR